MSLLSDARLIAEKDPAAKSTLEVVLLYPGFHALIFHRIAHALYRGKLFFLARLISQWGRFFTGIEIHPGAVIGEGLFIDHGMGIVIGETAEIGNNCTIYHGVTLGGTGKDRGKRHPTIGSNVLIGTGAKVLGPFRVGDNSMVGANSVVLKQIDSDTTVTGIPGRPVKSASVRVPSVDLDQINLPDPVMQEFCSFYDTLNMMERRIRQLEAQLEVQLESQFEAKIEAQSGSDSQAEFKAEF